jgi:hypothetical protein
MKMKSLILIALLAVIVLKCFSQDVTNKYLIGASMSYSHDDLTNNRLLSNYYTYDKNYSNAFEFSGEFGYFLNPSNLLGIEVGYLSNNSDIEGNSTVSKTKYSGFSLNPKYRLIKGFSDKILFYTDFKVVFQYLNHENEVTRINAYYEYEYLSMNGTESKYGLAINPGLIFKINKCTGVKIDYSLISALHSKIKKTDDSDINFDNINAWDYSLNMKLSGFNLGIIFTY